MGNLVELNVVTSQQSNENEFIRIAIHLPVTEDNMPVLIGSGRYALIALAQSAPGSPDAHYAVKFLKRDRESTVFSEIGRARFFEENDQTEKLSTKYEDSRFVH